MNSKKNSSLLITASVCAVSVLIMMCVLIYTGKSRQGEFTPPPFDENAVTGIPQVAENTGWGEIDAKVFKVSLCGKIYVEGGKSDIWFTNPETNSVWMKLRIIDENNNIIAETGLIKPGEYIKSIKYIVEPDKNDTINLKIMAYEPQTYYSAGSAVLKTTIS